MILFSSLSDFYGNVEQLGFDDLGYWAFILTVGAILIALLIGNLLIQVIKPLKKALIPAPVLGGFILFLVLGIYKLITKTSLVNTTVLEMITYHCLGLGFIATALKKKEEKDLAAEKNGGKGIFNSSLVTVSGYLIQAVLGLAVSVGLYFVMSGNVFPASGVLVPMGFGQGPGQALNWGKNYELSTTSEFGQFAFGKSFGLAVAAMGFIASAIGGIIYLAIQRKKGNPKFNIHADDYQETNTLETYEAKNEIPTSGTIDKFSVQLAMVLLVYCISFGIIFLISKLCDAALASDAAKAVATFTETGSYIWHEGKKDAITFALTGGATAEAVEAQVLAGGNFLTNTVKPLFWGFNFIVGVGVAALYKAVIGKFEKAGAIKKRYVNNYQLDRISGFTFDIMVVAAIASIDLSAFSKPAFTIPLLAMGVVTTVGTYFYIKWICKHLFNKEGYFEESFLCMYGMLTGTASTGVILLREIDPTFKTPALNNMVYQTLWSVVLGAPVLLLMSTVAQGWDGLILAAVIFVVYFLFINVLIFRDKIFKKKGKKA